MNNIVVVPYNAEWFTLFEQLRDHISTAVGDTAVAIEHVGSTAVPGLSAKPVIDMSIVVENLSGVATAIAQLATLGYKHRGNLGIEGREAFQNPPDTSAHHLYVCRQGSLALRNHLAVRDFLRSDTEAAESYGELKQKLAREHANDIDRYVEGKTDFLMDVLSACGLTETELDSISEANRRH